MTHHLMTFLSSMRRVACAGALLLWLCVFLTWAHATSFNFSATGNANGTSCYYNAIAGTQTVQMGSDSFSLSSFRKRDRASNDSFYVLLKGSHTLQQGDLFMVGGSAPGASVSCYYHEVSNPSSLPGSGNNSKSWDSTSGQITVTQLSATSITLRFDSVVLTSSRDGSVTLNGTLTTDTANPTPTPRPTATATATPAPTATAIPAATATPEPTATSTPAPTATATATPEPTATATPEPTATATPTPQPTATATPEPTATATPEPTATATATPEPTATATPTATPQPTATPKPAPTAAPLPVLSVNAPLVKEGNGGTGTALSQLVFTLSLSKASTTPVTVYVQSANASTSSAIARADYIPLSRKRVTFAPGQTRQTVALSIIGDTVYEENERVGLLLSSPVGATLKSTNAEGIILNDDPVPSISINDVSVPEGNRNYTRTTFTVTLSNPSTRQISVGYSTYGSGRGVAIGGTTTTPNVDYLTTTGTLSFAPSQTSKTVTVFVKGDTIVEGNEPFLVRLSAPVNARLVDNIGLGTIQNDDGASTTAATADSSSAGSS